MIRNASLFVIALASSASASATDLRIRTLRYDAEQIVRVSGRPGIQSTIEFGSDERIENIAVGDSAAWQVTPNRRASVIFLKPLVATSRSNMTVVTDRRTYMFDLVTSARGAPPLYALKFSYAEEELRAADTQPSPEKPAAVAVASVVAVPVRPDQFNFAWTSKGAASLLPERVFDDGSALYLAWHPNVPLPAIMTLSDDRKEETLNYRVEGAYIVVSPIPSNIVLRYAKSQASVWPSAPVRARAGSSPASPAPPPASVVAKSLPTPDNLSAVAPQAAAAPTKPKSAPVIALQEVATVTTARLAYPHSIMNENLTDAEHDQ